MSNSELVSPKDLIEYFGLNPETVTPQIVKDRLFKNGITNYHIGFNGYPCTTLEALNKSASDEGGKPVLVEVG